MTPGYDLDGEFVSHDLVEDRHVQRTRELSDALPALSPPTTMPSRLHCKQQQREQHPTGYGPIARDAVLSHPPTWPSRVQPASVIVSWLNLRCNR